VSVGALEGYGPQAASRSRIRRALLALAAVGMLATYSQFFVFPVFGEGPRLAAAGGLIRNLYFPAYAAGLLLVALSPADTLRALARQPFLLLLMAIVVISMTWSIAPDQTARRAFAVYCTTLGGIALAVRYRWTELAELTAACFAGLAVLSLVICLAIPSIGVMSEIFPGAWRGMWAEKNAFGGNMALGFVVTVAAAALNPRRAKMWASFAMLMLGLVLMSTSKTSLVSLLLGLGGLMMVAFARRGPAAGVMTVWVTVLGVAMFAAVMLFAADLFFGVLGKDATFTGRTKIWSAAMRQIAERPWTGYGYESVWTLEGPWGPLAWIVKDAGFKPQHAHNSWIEQWLGLGIGGLVAFGLMFLQTLVLTILAVFRHRGALLAAPLVIVYGLMTFTESVAVVYNDLRWVLFVAVAVKLAWPGEDAEEA
jgi:O-antigen ligase